MRFFIGIAATLMSIATVTVNAEPVVGLYQVREELVSQESTLRDAGLQQAFATLVQRLTGQKTAIQAPQLAAYQADPQALISRYGYDGNTLIVNFDPQSVQSALRSAHLPLWGSNRPLVLAWWLVDDEQGTRLISDGQSLATHLQSAAHYYGIPARLPLGDLDEQLLASAEALSHNDAQAVRQAAERYNADAVLSVHQQANGQTLQAQWQLWVGEERQQGQVSADAQKALSEQVFAEVNQRLAERFAIKPGQGETFIIRVAAIDLEHFVLVERLLEPFAAQLQEVTKEYAQWQVRSTGEQLRAQLTLAHLKETALPVATAESAPIDATGSDIARQTAPQLADSSDSVLYFTW
jgi:hypothetical protein